VITAKIVVYGKVTKIKGNMIYVRRGETVDIYNADYYRVVHTA
jgi:hypothetical protein